jgi:HAD superfamily hydrolase (TIGR01509 family)
MQNYQILAKLTGRELPTEEIDRMSEWKENRYRQLVAGCKLVLMDGVKPLLDSLKQKGFLLAIGTSTPRVNLTLMLEHTGINDYFNAFVTGEDVDRGKPAPQTFLKAAEKLSLAPCRCIVVEDAVQGVQAGKAAAMPVIAITTTRKRVDLNNADLIVDSLTELKADDFVSLLPNPKQS